MPEIPERIIRHFFKLRYQQKAAVGAVAYCISIRFCHGDSSHSNGKAVLVHDNKGLTECFFRLFAKQPEKEIGRTSR
jgi:hypothetical protein